MGVGDFARRLTAWQRCHGRKDLPWQNTRDAYRIWLSEIMLQQTQVATVIPYYQRFLERFPEIGRLASADMDDVLQAWSGLGYYSRARNLHRAAQLVVSTHGGRFPSEREELEALPGVGRSTAAAIAVFAFARREAILDGNVKRVLGRHFAIAGFPGDKKVADRLWQLAASLLPRSDIEGYTQALMDLGATICTRSPDCGRCPVQQSCAALAADAVMDYPTPRPRRRLSLRETTMLILVHREKVLLVRRAPVGVWGGLWSLPELPDGNMETAIASWEQRYGCQLQRTEALPTLRHVFSHFALDIRPLLCRVERVGRRAASADERWLQLSQAADMGVPAPVRKLLRQIRSTAKH